MNTRLPALLVLLAATGCSYTIDPLKNYCAEPDIAAAIVKTANAPSPLPDITNPPASSAATTFTNGIIRDSLFGSHYQVLACQGTLTRADGTQEKGIAVASRKDGNTGWRDLWLDPASPDYMRAWLSDERMSAFKERQISEKIARTPTQCKPYAEDLFHQTHTTGLEDGALRSTLYSCLSAHHFKPMLTPSGVARGQGAQPLPTFYIPYYLNPEIELSGLQYY
ncbi:hypothetical protein [Acetobacter estunensis]|uniref:hypothetical protein n=1 Tax=Acetobacter estunensis TaxID=104097 RepID=UPI001C2D832F|nr:hypothetical protein [Acetobacter estunensis]MBV1835728.1 hypothetical protein [Acetobacter estunensis]MBV1836011.1 hypothetical protein [Acetobacter estunensis]